MSCMGRPTIWSLVCFATGLSAAFPASPSSTPKAWAGGLATPSDRWTSWPASCCWPDVTCGTARRLRRALLHVRRGRRPGRAGPAPSATDRSLAPDAKILHLGGGSSPALGKQVLLFRGQGHARAQAVARAGRVGGRALLLAGVWLRARAGLGPCDRRGADRRRRGVPNRAVHVGRPVGPSARVARRLAGPQPTGPRRPPPATYHRLGSWQATTYGAPMRGPRRTDLGLVSELQLRPGPPEAG